MKRAIYVFSCVSILVNLGCHSQNGLGLNENASVNSLGDLPENPLLLSAITSSILSKDSTMSVLYGNEPAYDYAKENGDGNYPAGAVIYEVTWQMQRDDQWFGANVPKEIKTVERVEFYKNRKTSYNLFEGRRFKKSNPIDEIERLDFISGQRMAVSP